MGCVCERHMSNNRASGLNETSPFPISSSFRPAKEAKKH